MGHSASTRRSSRSRRPVFRNAPGQRTPKAVGPGASLLGGTLLAIAVEAVFTKEEVHTPIRRIGPIGTGSRLLVATALLYLALVKGASWGLHWYDALLGLVVLPGALLIVSLVLSRRGSAPLRLTGSLGTLVNCAVIVGLVGNPYTARGAELFYGATLLIAAWRGQPDCESTVISNWILGRDDQVGCPIFSPIDRFEARRAPAS